MEATVSVTSVSSQAYIIVIIISYISHILLTFTEMDVS